MLSWIIKSAIVSITLIFLIHHLLYFFKSMLTVPKIKDLVNAPTQKYEHMYNIINHSKSNFAPTKTSDDYTLIDLLPKNEDNENNMKNELKSFLKSQLHDSSPDSIINSTDTYSAF